MEREEIIKSIKDVLEELNYELVEQEHNYETYKLLDLYKGLKTVKDIILNL